ncbi:MAG: hypothetical protein U1F68_09145 [Gammaproteobacteria bacterium]
MTIKTLANQNRAFGGTGGVSCENRCLGFVPGFLDRETGTIYLSRKADGTPAPIHLMDGLPAELVIARTSSGQVASIKGTVIAGFILDGHFYTREQAAHILNLIA